MKELIAAVVQWVNRFDKRVIIGITGHGAAGKTTFSAQLIQALGQEVAYLNADPYIIPSDIRRHTQIDYEFEGKRYRSKMTACHPSAHHLLSLERDIRMLRDGLDLYTMDVPYLKTERLTPKKVTVVEGMSAAFADPTLFDLKIFLYTDDETELARRTKRDIAERGSTLDFLKRSHDQRRIQYKLFMHPYSERADIVAKTSNAGIEIEKAVFPN